VQPKEGKGVKEGCNRFVAEPESRRRAYGRRKRSRDRGGGMGELSERGGGIVSVYGEGKEKKWRER